MNRIKFIYIDHQRVAIEGAHALNEAIRNNDLEILRKYLEQLRFYPEDSIVEFRADRINKLKEISAPAEMIEMEIETLSLINGDAYVRDVLEKDGFDILRQKLVNLFIPWNGFECYFKDEVSTRVAEMFPLKMNLPVDINGVPLTSENLCFAIKSGSYLAPNDIIEFPKVDIDFINSLVHEESDLLFSEFIQRAIDQGLGIAYEISSDIGP